jgi:exodeoxyribonuclease-3
MKIATWNVNSLRVRLPHVLAWLETNEPDILCLQELKLPDEEFPFLALKEAGYEAVAAGQKTYNGVAILSRAPLYDAQINLPNLEDQQRRLLAATWNGVRIINLYIPNGESLTSVKYQYKLNWLNHLVSYLEGEVKKFPKIIMVGDFNIAPEDKDVYDPIAWRDHVLCSEPERNAFKIMLQLGFDDCFRLISLDEKAFSWWDYRLNAFKRNMGMRIDHILASRVLSAHCKKSVIDKVPRTWERPSDHTPVVAEFEWPEK